MSFPYCGMTFGPKAVMIPSVGGTPYRIFPFHCSLNANVRKFPFGGVTLSGLRKVYEAKMKNPKADNFQHFPLPKGYKKIISKVEKVLLAVVGKDPFPQSPVGIPFCKTTWEEMTGYGCSGFYVLKSLGINIDKAKKSFSPETLFMELASLGIVFLNV